MKKSFVLFLTFVLSFVFTASAFAAGATVLKAGHSATNKEPYQLGLEAFGKKLKETTNGKFEVKVFPSCQLGSEKEMTEGLFLGNVDVATSATTVVTNFIPEFIVYDLPFLFNSDEHFYKASDGAPGKFFVDACAKKGIRLLAIYDAGVRHIASKKPVNSMKDLKGMKIRTMQSQIHIDAFNGFGAKATPMAFSEQFSALEQGVIDGVEASNTSCYNQQFYRPAPNWALVSWYRCVTAMMMSEKKFQSYPKDVQKAILEAAAYSAKVEREAYAKSESASLDAMKKAGVNITKPDVAPFKEVAQKVADKYIKKPELKEVLKQIQDMGK
ncbi:MULTISPECIES: TRAP transporter substrate-binding protein [Cloacibacillus]|uniref:TRAP transporter substrate-binding protein n=1 Tax=Cloacibacillus TaxID=508459 RepID=UPI0014598441|nr:MULTISPECIES: TRAP transporter substrate-binding protein [Cloacibacillus]MCC8057547.1 TRAP transporter substrate-binding protein [Cloacibacillus sp.]MCC8184736.1 TRAP transporter substrate-binding protein [Cloacibacillus porcorum]MCI5863763.1 TRAP transporter substrate-binding protein [Cloacibacillus porcorum]MDD7649585.1 TRAP transporter substrate-binding protein [Cloacibacillus porcorum]MDY4092465.1 TRAP transporter substrate-binding protein [Cloacibacillus porcorum]